MQQFDQHLVIGHVALLRPASGQNRTRDVHGRQWAMGQIGGNGQTGRIVATHRKILGLEVQRHIQVLAKALQLHQAVSLALGRTLA